MSQNKRGMTVDLGYPLAGADMDLFIHLFQEAETRCIDWVKDRAETGPMMIGGQIGAGKTTLLNHMFLESGIEPDLRLCFDKDDFVVGVEGFLGYVLFKTLRQMHGLNIDAGKWGESGDLLKTVGLSFDQMIASFFFKVMDREARAAREALLKLFGEYADEFKIQLTEMIEAMADVLGRPPLILCGGLDKYKYSGADIRLLAPTLSALSGSRGKLLYELNLPFIINPDFDWQGKEASMVVLPAAEDDNIKELLRRRAGIYSHFRESAFDILARFSGGNPRQAVRLQAEFEYAYEKLGKSKDDAINHACNRVRNDFLRGGAVDFSLEHLKTVKNDGFFIPAEESPIYWNWILATAEPELGRIPSKINPLLLPSVETFDGPPPEDPEIEKLKRWAREHDTSPIGLTIPSDMSFESFLDEMNSADLPEPALTLESIFMELASFFLSQRFNSLYLILYKDFEAAELASDYICGKAGLLAEKSFVKGGIDGAVVSFNQFHDLLKIHDGLSLFFDESLEADDVRWCELKRDQLVGKRIIFWANHDKALSYLNVWPQLRQFIKIVELEKELWADIGVEDVEEDLRLLEEVAIPDENRGKIKERMDRVLRSIKGELEGHD